MTDKTYPPTGYPLLPMHIRHADDVFSQIECEAFNAAVKHYLRSGEPPSTSLYKHLDAMRLRSIQARFNLDHTKP